MKIMVGMTDSAIKALDTEWRKPGKRRRGGALHVFNNNPFIDYDVMDAEVRHVRSPGGSWKRQRH
jgi:hypothetical protein